MCKRFLPTPYLHACVAGMCCNVYVTGSENTVQLIGVMGSIVYTTNVRRNIILTQNIVGHPRYTDALRFVNTVITCTVCYLDTLL